MLSTEGTLPLVDRPETINFPVVEKQGSFVKVQVVETFQLSCLPTFGGKVTRSKQIASTKSLQYIHTVRCF